MDTNRFDCWSSSLAGPERHTLPMPSPHLDAITRAMGAATSRRRVLGAVLVALVAPRFFASGAVAKQEATCPGPDCPCPCTDPPCLLRAWGGGQFGFPLGVAVSSDGTVYVADTYNNRIQVLSASRAVAGSWGRFGASEWQVRQPSGVTVAANGTVYVVDQGNHIRSRS